MTKKIIALFLTAVISISFFSIPASAETYIYGAGLVNTKSTNLTIRKSKSTESAAIGSLKKGSYVTLIAKSGSWWKVEYNDNQYGYCSSKYITVNSRNVGYAKTKNSALSIRSGEGTDYPVLGKFKQNQRFAILSKGDTWSKILYNGIKIGYVHNDYIGDTYSSVTLSVKNFKQTDSRWADVKLGNSNATIRNSGCVVSSLANTESYRTKTTVTPKMLATSLKFTSGGAVYWPKQYSFYSNSDYLSVIYKKLHAGIPVIIGGKSNKGTHYVTVYGFRNSISLSPENFLIRDPGSSKNKTLNQFFKSYPTFIKLAYYN